MKNVSLLILDIWSLDKPKDVPAVISGQARS